jgi:hypothetical protein
MSCSQRGGSSTAVFSVSRPQPIFFLSSSSSIVLTRPGGPCSRPTTSQRIEPRPLDLQPGTVTTRPQRRSNQYKIKMLNENCYVFNVFFTCASSPILQVYRFFLVAFEEQKVKIRTVPLTHILQTPKS